MLRHLTKRFFLTLLALWLVLTLVLLMIYIVPSDPVEQMLGEGAATGNSLNCAMHSDWICRLSPWSNPRPRCRRVCSLRMIGDTGQSVRMDNGALSLVRLR